MTPTDGLPQDLRAIGRLPGGLEVEIRHRRAAGPAGPEQLVLSLTAPAGFETWGRLMEASNPMLAWIQVWEAAWAPWLALMGMVPPRLSARGRPHR
ncbi:hypothetical protein [Paracraurococcus lichenis]|uniref:Uncharacterized protein n=1 Tax=Paracraurococcus lichenis TaxID=3064888 RepID=A0ABT9E115_9PROT|nr:hypothetical protein [Paracraurococcus sp. LOR1-02]MDO9709812.1 hypothetical protein [Paracraurococcus sp. LOR1-02]